ncbi:phosphopantetheine-binding protein [Seohaeicola zhoushanensis]
MYVLVEALTQDADLRRLRGDLSEWLKIPPDSFVLETIDRIPRRSNGKPDLQAIGRRIAEMEASASAGARKSALTRIFRRGQSVEEVFRKQFGADQVKENSTFASLGGDSLTYVELSLALESVLGALPEDWANMTVAQLKQKRKSRKFISSIDTPTLVRALAIMAVVSGHFHFVDYGRGGAFSLFVVAGLTFALFTLPQVLEHQRITPIANLFFRIAGLTLAYMALHLILTGYGEWPAFLFVGSYFSPHTEGALWFIEIYLQFLLVAMAVLSLPAARRALESHAFLCSAVAAAAFVGIGAVSDMLFDLHHLFRRVPHLMAWYFLLGVAIGSADKLAHRLVLSAILAVGSWQFGGYGLPRIGFFHVAALALIWLPAVPLPSLLRSPIRQVAGASLLIYLSHFQFGQALAKIMNEPAAGLKWAAALAGGVLLWRLYNPVDLWLSRRVAGFLSRAKT